MYMYLSPCVSSHPLGIALVDSSGEGISHQPTGHLLQPSLTQLTTNMAATNDSRVSLTAKGVGCGRMRRL